MGAAKKLYDVNVKCEISQEQIEAAVNYVSSCLPQDLEDLNDIDEPMFDNTLRVIVDFKVGVFKVLEVKEALLQNKDGETMPLESAIFTSLLIPVMKSYNLDRKFFKNQAREIKAMEVF